MVAILRKYFLYEDRWVFIKIWLKSIPEGSVKNKSALFQIMAWRRTGNMALSEPMLVYLTDAYMRQTACMS